MCQINEFIVEMGDNFEIIMDAYFETFKEKMQSRCIIPKKLVEDYEQDICSLVDCDKVHIQVVRLRVAWVKTLGYEVKINDTRDVIEDLLNKPMDPKAPYFGTYEEEKARIALEIKLPQALKRGRNEVEKILKDTKSSNSLLLLTEGKGDDIKEEGGDEVNAKEEESREEEHPKKKGKVIITKTKKSSPVGFSRRTTKLRKK